MSVSIHAPSRERQEIRKGDHKIWRFNPRSLTGETLPAAIFPRTLCYFNPRSLTGATRRQEQAVTFMSISIHAPSRERHSNKKGDSDSR